MTWYKPNWFHGNHEFKVGFDYSNDSESAGRPRSRSTTICSTNDGVPFEIAFFNAPTFAELAARRYLGIYVKDSWTVGRRLTLNLGLRYARDRRVRAGRSAATAAARSSDVVFPAQCFPQVELPIWNSVAPRLHAAYDLVGRWQDRDQGRVGALRPHAPARAGRRSGCPRIAIAYGIYQWRDLNGNNDYNPGEVNLDPNGPDFVETAGAEFDEPVTEGRGEPQREATQAR